MQRNIGVPSLAFKRNRTKANWQVSCRCCVDAAASARYSAASSMRLFLALLPPPPVRAILSATMAGISGARWQSDAQLHLTLAFLGDVDDRRAAALDAALSAQLPRSFDIAIDGVSHFEDRGYPTAIWAKALPSDPLLALAARVARMAEGCGVALERRRFIPHITLARLNRSSGPIGDWLVAHSALAAPPWTADRYHLMESQLNGGGAIYTRLADYPLR
jgi:RNA 2',3'-cyclic 3'-phosphodiesterase